MKRQSSETAQNMILDEVAPQFVPGRRPRVSPPPIEASKLGVNVFEPAITMVKLHEELHEAAMRLGMLLSEINEHSLIVVDTDGRTTEIRPSPVEALMMMMMIVYATNVPTDNIIKGNEPLTMSKIGTLMDLA